jgi:hypothetical protein
VFRHRQPPLFGQPVYPRRHEEHDEAQGRQHPIYSELGQQMM